MEEILGLLSDEDKGFLVACLQKSTRGGPAPSRETLRFFTKDAVRKALDAAEPHLNEYGLTLLGNIRREL